MHDVVIVGAGLYGATFAHLARKRGLSVLVIDKRDHIAGNAFTKNVDGIHQHVYGAHIFHTNNHTIWQFVNQFGVFDQFQLNVKAQSDKLYSLPFNMNTFYEMWGCKRPSEAQQIIASQTLKLNREPRNLEEHALSQVGHDIYERLIYAYTKRQWGCEPSTLPASIIKRLPLRFEYNNNYFNDVYQGIPRDGYTQIVENMLDGCEVELGVDYFKNRTVWDTAKILVYTGPIDRFFNFEYGRLPYRSLEFEHHLVPLTASQGTAVINNCTSGMKHTRTIEHRYFMHDCRSSNSLVTLEYSLHTHPEAEPFYPINTDENQEIFRKYKQSAVKLPNTIIGGRLGEYRYYDMHQVIASAMADFSRFFDANSTL